MKTIGKNIAYFRKKNGLTQEELAEKMNITAQAISKWENDISYPDLPLTQTLASLLSCTVDELLNGEVNYPTATDATEEQIMGRIITVYVESLEAYGVPESKVTLRLPVSYILNAYEGGFLEKIIPNGFSEKLTPVVDMIKQGITGELVNIEENSAIVRITVEDYEH